MYYEFICLYAMALNIALAFLLLEVVATLTAETQVASIFEPQLDVIHRFPWNAYLSNGCSASVIGRRRILTAAYCVCARNVDNLTVTTGVTDVAKEKGRTYEIAGRRVAPKYLMRNCFDLEYSFRDMAVLETATDIVFDEKVQPIKFNARPVEKSKKVVLTGYGYPSKNDDSKKLRYRLVTAKACDIAEAGGRMLCTPLSQSNLKFGYGGAMVRCMKIEEKLQTGNMTNCRLIGIHSNTDKGHYASIAENYYFVHINKKLPL